MEKRTKIIIGVVAGLAIIGGIVYYRNKKKKQKLQQMTQDDELDSTDVDVVVKEDSPDVTVDMTKSGSKARATFPMGYLSYRENGLHAVHLNKRPPSGTIKKGDKVNIKGTSFDGKYDVTDVWIDKSNNVGAMYLKISYKPTGKNDTTFVNKGVIELL